MALYIRVKLERDSCLRITRGQVCYTRTEIASRRDSLSRAGWRRYRGYKKETEREIKRLARARLALSRARLRRVNCFFYFIWRVGEARTAVGFRIGLLFCFVFKGLRGIWGRERRKSYLWMKRERFMMIIEY